MDLADIDLLDEDRFVRGVPHEWLAYLRANAPVYKHPEPRGPGFWVLTKHADVSAVGRDPETFSSSAELGGVDDLADPPPERPEELQGAIAFEGKMLPLIDPPEHTQYRKIVHEAFRPRSIAALQNDIRETAADVIESAVTRGKFDFAVDVATEMTSRTIADLLGMPLEDRYKISDWTKRITESEHRDDVVRRRDAKAAFLEAHDYAKTLAEDRRRHPRDDILTAVLNAEVDGHALSEPDFTNFLVLLGVAGEQTVRHTLSQGIAAFLDDPAQYRMLVEDHSLIDPAVEEFLRWGTPALYFRRTATKDTSIRGVEIAEGDKVSLWYISANRDEEVFDDPFRFDVRRRPNEHVAFGHGNHFCLGSHLARLEIKVFLEELVKRVMSFAPAGEIVRLRSNQIHGIKHLPLRFVEVRQPVGA